MRAGLPVEIGGIIGGPHYLLAEESGGVPAPAGSPSRNNCTKELAHRLWDYRRVPTAATRHLQDQLSSCPAFVETAPSEWQFGRRALN